MPNIIRVNDEDRRRASRIAFRSVLPLIVVTAILIVVLLVRILGEGV